MARSRSSSWSEVLDDQLCFDLYSAARAMTRRYRPLLEEHGITYPQYLVLLLLGGEGEQSIKDLAGAMHIDHATLTPMLHRLEKAGLVARQRDTSDGRVVRLRLTARGQSVHSAAADIQCRVRDDLDMSPEEVRHLQVTLRDVAASMERAAVAGV